MNTDVEKLYEKFNSIPPLLNVNVESTMAFNQLSGFLMGYVKDNPAIPVEQQLTIMEKIVELQERHNR